MNIKHLLLSLTVAALTAQAQQVKVVPEVMPKQPCNEILDLQPTGKFLLEYYPDVVYKHIDGVNLRLQILTPRTKQKHPCIVYVKGSAWKQQKLYRNVPALSRFAERGYVIAIVEYRHTGIAKFPAQVEDTKTAIRFMRMNADKYNVDPTNVFVWGDSSGGHTAYFCGMTGEEQFCDTTYSRYSCRVNAAVAYYGPSDISTMKDAPSTWDHNSSESTLAYLVGGEISTHMDAARKASPLYYISKKKPIAPLFIAFGTKDRIVPFVQGEQMVEALRKAKKEVDYYVIKGADHGSWQFWTDTMFDRVESFVKRHLQKG